MQTKHKIALLGPIPYDHITMWNNELLDRYGCLTYPVIALSKLFGRGARITPVTHVRKKDQQTIKAILTGYAGVELNHIFADKDQGDVMQLKFLNKYKCLEKQYGFMDPIMPSDIKHILDTKMFLVLPVTDYEVSLETLQFIKSYSEADIVFDAHGVTRAMTVLGDRVNKFWVDRDLWLPYIDVLSLTLAQAKCCWFAKEYSLEQLEENEDLSEDELQAFVAHCFSKGVKAVYLRLEEEGCIVYSHNDTSKINAVQLEAPIIDTTGRGESFAAGLAYGLICHNNDYVRAAYYGNVMEAQRIRGESYDVFMNLAEIEQVIEESYGKS